MTALLNETDLIDRIFAHIDGKTTDKKMSYSLTLEKRP